MRGCLDLQTKYAHVTFDNQLDTSSPSGKLVFNIIGAVAEFEREIIRERVRAGLANARQKGKMLGRPRIPKVRSERNHFTEKSRIIESSDR